MKLSIIVPVYNEEELVAEVLRRVLDAPTSGLEREIIVVDDGSTDASCDIVGQFVSEHSTIRLYASPINLGKGAAIRIGFKLATGDLILIQDADLELDPSEYPRLLAPVLAGKAEVVYGSRFKSPNPGIPPLYLWGNRLLTYVTNLLYGAHLTDMETGYKLFKAYVLRSLSLRCTGFCIEPEITAKILKASYRIVEVPVSYHPRTGQEGKKISWKDGFEALYTLLRCRFGE